MVKYILVYIFSSVFFLIALFIVGLFLHSGLFDIIYEEFIALATLIISIFISIFSLKKLLPFLISDDTMFTSLPKWRVGKREVLIFLSVIIVFYGLCRCFAYAGFLSFELVSGVMWERMLFLVFLFMGAFLEEYFFRHLLFKHFSPSWGLILLNALFFSFIHLSNSITALIYISLGGITYCLVYLKTRNFAYPVLLHFGENFSLWINGDGYTKGAVIFLQKMTENKLLFQGVHTSLIIQFIFSIIILVLVLLYKRKQFDLWRLCFREEKSLG